VKAATPTAQLCLGATLSTIKTSGGIESRLGRRGERQLLNWDASLIKTTKFTERQTPQFRTEFFNLFNHPQFGNPATSRNTPGTFGQITTTNPHVIQPAWKHIF
jgi:hypothetical protein